jgi:hypothetical protein
LHIPVILVGHSSIPFAFLRHRCHYDERSCSAAPLRLRGKPSHRHRGDGRQAAYRNACCSTRASWTSSRVFRRFGRRTRRGLVIAFPIRRRFLALSHTEFAETRDISDGVVAAAVAVASRWGNRSPPFALPKPVSRKTELTGCFRNAVSTGS